MSTTASIHAVGDDEDPDGNDPIDPLDPTRHLIDPRTVDVELEMITVDVRKPKRTEFFQVHPDPTFTVDVTILERDNGMDKDSFLVAESVRHLVAEELRSVRLFTVINKHKVIYLWGVRLPGDNDERLRKMADAQLRAAERAKKAWIKLIWNKHLGAHEMFAAKGDLGSPQWPDKSFKDLFRLAFESNLINRPDHPVIQELNGEM